MTRQLLALMIPLLLWSPPLAAAAEGGSPIVFIYDSSGSMWGQIDGKSKVEIAREVMATTIADLPATQQVGLVAYGHRSEGDCKDVETLLTKAAPGAVNPALQAIRPLGKTPLAWSATQVIEQLDRDGQKATVILLTDGAESCGGNLCEVVRAARASGVEFVMHIVGFGLKPGETEPLQCAAEAAGGSYFDANNAAELAAGLGEATARTVDLAANTSVKATKNGQPLDVYVQAFPASEKKAEKKAVATVRSYERAALFHLPAGTYDLKVSALAGTDLQPIWISGIEVSAEELSEHEVNFDAGVVRLNTLNNGKGWDALVKLLQGEVVVAQTRTYGRPQDMQVPPGVYLARVQAMVLQGTATLVDLPDVQVMAGEVSEVVHSFESGIAMIGVSQGDELVDAVVNITDLKTGKRVAASRTYTSAESNPREFLLTPGAYTVEFTPLGKHQGPKDTFEMTIEPGETFEKRVQLP